MHALGEFWSYVTTSEHWSGNRGITHRVVEHLRLAGFSVVLAAILALPPAVILGHLRRGGLVAVWTVNVGRALPSFAIIALVLPISLRYGFGLGFWPTAVALVLLAVPPMFTNTYTGVRDVDAAVVEAARGMGMRARSVLWGVEIPAALPLIITGLRVSAVQVVATATLGAFVGFDALGSFIVEGFAQQDDGKLLTGAILVAVLSLLVEVGFGWLQKILTPWSPTRLVGRSDDVTVDATVLGEVPLADEVVAEA